MQASEKVLKLLKLLHQTIICSINKYMVGVSDNLVHEEVILLVNISYHLDRGGL